MSVFFAHIDVVAEWIRMAWSRIGRSKGLTAKKRVCLVRSKP